MFYVGLDRKIGPKRPAFVIAMNSAYLEMHCT